MAAVPLSGRELLARLVGFDSVSRNSNVPIADFICEYVDRPGVSISRPQGPEPGKVNVIITAGPQGAGGGLTLSGHLDVVPADEEGWRSDPFALTDSDATWVGRGTSDMKGSIALFLNILAALNPARLRNPLALLLTCDEEVGTLGSQHFTRTWPAGQALPRQVVVGEPTSLRAVRMHKGHLSMRVSSRGKAAHSGSPHLGINAIETGARVVAALVRLGAILQQKRCDTSAFFPAVPYPVLCVSRIRGGEAVNVVPDECVIDLGVRLLPGMNTQAAIEWVRDAAIKSDPQGRIAVEVVNNSPALLTGEKVPIHEALCGLLDQSRSFGVTFASDAGPLAEAGYECVLFGPGSIESAHRANEFLPIAEFARARTILQQLTDRFCLA